MPKDEAEQARDAAALQQRVASVARRLADTEDQVAATFEAIAEGNPTRAERLRVLAADAREQAGCEREVAARLSYCDPERRIDSD